MLDSLTIAHDFNRHISGSLPRTEYRKVTACLLYWLENDLKGCTAEVDKLRRLLEDGFEFSTYTFQIPNERSEANLHKDCCLVFRPVDINHRILCWSW